MKSKYVEIFFNWLKFFILSGVLVFIIRGFIFIPMTVEGNSMEKNLYENDQIIIERYSNIQRFDVIVFKLPDNTTYIKRVIGLPGDHVVYKDDQLYINGKKVAETFLDDFKAKNKLSNFYTTNFDSEDILDRKEVPKDAYFVLGDNRRLSKDSRSFGLVKGTQVFGKARMVYYPFQHFQIIN